MILTLQCIAYIILRSSIYFTTHIACSDLLYLLLLYPTFQHIACFILQSVILCRLWNCSSAFKSRLNSKSAIKILDSNTLRDIKKFKSTPKIPTSSVQPELVFNIPDNTIDWFHRHGDHPPFKGYSCPIDRPLSNPLKFLRYMSVALALLTPVMTKIYLFAPKVYPLKRGRADVRENPTYQLLRIEGFTSRRSQSN